MTGTRIYTLGIFCFWAAAMSWLVATKVAPALRGGDRPQYVALPAEPGGGPQIDCWTMSWDERKVGWAASMVERHSDGLAQSKSYVQFDELPLDEMLDQMFGAAARIFRPLLGEGGVDVPMSIQSRMLFNSLDQLVDFETQVRLSPEQRLALLRGKIDEGRLQLRVQLGEAVLGGEPPEFKREIQLSPDALVVDAFTPQSKLYPLWVGQAWTMRVYRPFPPSSPERLIEGRVEELTQLEWQGEEVEAFLVVYRDDPGAGVTATREPLSRMWVRRDGLVLRQEIAIGSKRFALERMSGDEAEDAKERLRSIMTR